MSYSADDDYTTPTPIWISEQGLLYVESSEYALYYYTSTVGALISTIIIILILIFTVYKYINFDPDQQQNTSIYVVFFIYCLSVMITGIEYAFVRANIFTQQSPFKFTHFQCILSTISSLILFIIAQTCSYFLFIRRIQIAFQNTTYQYPPILFKILYIILALVTIFLLTLTILGTANEYGLYYFDSNAQHIWCDVLGDDAAATEISSDVRLYGALASAVNGGYQIILNIVLLYMFTKRFVHASYIMFLINEPLAIIPTDYTHFKWYWWTSICRKRTEIEHCQAQELVQFQVIIIIQVILKLMSSKLQNQMLLNCNKGMEHQCQRQILQSHLL